MIPNTSKPIKALKKLKYSCFATNIIPYKIDESLIPLITSNDSHVKLSWNAIVSNFFELFRMNSENDIKGKKIHFDTNFNLGSSFQYVDGAREGRYVYTLLLDCMNTILHVNSYHYDHRFQRRVFYQLKEFVVAILIEYFTSYQGNETIRSQDTTPVMYCIDPNKPMVPQLFEYYIRHANEPNIFDTENFIVDDFDNWNDIETLEKRIINEFNHRKGYMKFKSMTSILLDLFSPANCGFNDFRVVINVVITSVIKTLLPILNSFKIFDGMSIAMCLMNHPLESTLNEYCFNEEYNTNYINSCDSSESDSTSTCDDDSKLIRVSKRLKRMKKEELEDSEEVFDDSFFFNIEKLNNKLDFKKNWNFNTISIEELNPIDFPFSNDEDIINEYTYQR